MRIAMFLDSPPEATGPFQQSLAFIHSVVRAGLHKHKIVVFAANERIKRRLAELGIDSISYKSSGLAAFLDRCSTSAFCWPILYRLRRLGLRRLGRQLDALLHDYDVDLVLLNDSPQIAWRIGEHPFIVTVWDMFWHDRVVFPENYADRIFERRFAALRATVPRAVAVITNFSTVARRVAEVFDVDVSRIAVLPAPPALAVQRCARSKRTAADVVRRKYNLPEHYIFYPARFSSYKNHLYLLEALIELERHHSITLHATFCGGDGDGRSKIMSQVIALGLSNRVRLLGFVPDEDIPLLYKGADALVIPSYCGTDVLPPLEASLVDCPAICSDLPEFREQMGEAALYCDLSDPSSLADRLKELGDDPALQQRLRKARQRLRKQIESIDYAELMQNVLNDFARLHRLGAWPEAGFGRVPDRAGRIR